MRSIAHKENDIMTAHPEITVLTIVYNGERYIGEAIDSILNQTYKNFEYILVDNNSTDNTPSILRDYALKEKRIKIIKEMKQGPLYARNAGLQSAKGGWIAILDADDVAFPTRLEYQLDLVKKNPSIVLLGSSCNMIDEDGKFIKRHDYPSDHEALVSRLENHQAFFPHSSAFFKKQTVDKLNGYHFPHAEDYDLWLRLSMYGEIVCIHQPLIKLRRSIMSRSYNISQEAYALFGIAALACHLRRKKGLIDPSLSKKEDWENFLTWTKTRMESLNVFKKSNAIRELNRLRYSKENNKLYRMFQMLYQLLTNRFARAFLLERSYLKNAALQIAEESQTEFKAYSGF